MFGFPPPLPPPPLPPLARMREPTPLIRAWTMAGAVAAATATIAVAAVVNFMAKLICGRSVEAVRQSATFATFLNQCSQLSTHAQLLAGPTVRPKSGSACISEFSSVGNGPLCRVSCVRYCRPQFIFMRCVRARLATSASCRIFLCMKYTTCKPFVYLGEDFGKSFAIKEPNHAHHLRCR